MIKFLGYYDSKEHIIPLVNNLGLINIDHKRYIELFVGSGTIFINLPDVFLMNMLHQCGMYLSFFLYEEYQDALNFISKTFSDIKENKKSYYDFREYYNIVYHFTNTSKKGLYLYFLTNSYINSMFRFGPNRMN